jgi:hypothetical protein
MPSRIEEQLRRVAGRAHLEPRLHRCSCLLPKWEHALAASLADNVHGGQRAVDLIEAKTDQLRDAHAGSEGQMQHRPVADAGDGAWVRRIEQSLQLVTYEIANKRLIGLLHRNRMNPARQDGTLWPIRTGVACKYQ